LPRNNGDLSQVTPLSTVRKRKIESQITFEDIERCDELGHLGAGEVLTVM
jgi:hypothetical protein